MAKSKADPRPDSATARPAVDTSQLSRRPSRTRDRNEKSEVPVQIQRPGVHVVPIQHMLRISQHPPACNSVQRATAGSSSTSGDLKPSSSAPLTDEAGRHRKRADSIIRRGRQLPRHGPSRVRSTAGNSVIHLQALLFPLDRRVLQVRELRDDEPLRLRRCCRSEETLILLTRGRGN